MMRLALAALAALSLIGAARPDSIDYTVGVVAQSTGAPVLQVDIALRGDPDGQTQLKLPGEFAGTRDAWRYLYGLTVKGAKVAGDGATRTLSHRRNARLAIRYYVRSAYEQDPQGADGNPYRGPLLRPDWMGVFGEFVFAIPEGRAATPITFKWGQLPAGWRVASDLEHGAAGRRVTLDDVAESFTVAGANLAVTERPIAGGTLRVVAPAQAETLLPAIADASAATISAERAFWNDLQGPYLVAFVPLAAKPTGYSVGGTGRGDGFVLYATPGEAARLAPFIAHEHTHTWIPGRVGRLPAREAEAYWLSEGFTDFYTWRTRLRGGLAPLPQLVETLQDTLSAYEASPVRTAPNARIAADFWTDRDVQRLAYQRGALLALKWDEDLRQKSGGKLDLDDVMLKMRDHYGQFAPGQGPDVVTGLLSAAWVTAGLDLGADVDRYAVKGELVPLQETLFDGCLFVRTNRRPTFDLGFDATASQAARQFKGVRRDGPAWASGLRNGAVMENLKFRAGDTSLQVELVTRDTRRRPKTVRYWPYGDGFIETHDFVLKPRMDAAESAACAKRIAGA